MEGLIVAMSQALHKGAACSRCGLRMQMRLWISKAGSQISFAVGERSLQQPSTWTFLSLLCELGAGRNAEAMFFLLTLPTHLNRRGSNALWKLLSKPQVK